MAGIEAEGRTAPVTNGSRGIGRGVAPRLAECGVGRTGVLHPRYRKGAGETARLLPDRAAEATPIRADLTRAEDIARRFADDRPAVAGPDLDAALRSRLAVADAAFVADGIALGLPLVRAGGVPRRDDRAPPTGVRRTRPAPEPGTGWRR
jgi:NAD(P)-dependent dehydrogenase (short-subunit alcohol dehydrogenase family)